MSWTPSHGLNLSTSLPILLTALCLYCSDPALRGQTPTAPDIRTFSLAAQQGGKLTCPGGFPMDLTSTNCEFTETDRLQQWVNSSFTDLAMLGAVTYGTGAQIVKSPGEWGRTWGGFGDRIGVRYTQAAASGTAEFLVGSLLNDNPSHLSYKQDPHTHWGAKSSCDPRNGVSVTAYPTPRLSA